MSDWKWPDARGWIGIASFTLTLIVMAILVWGPPGLREDEFFKTIATAIVMTGFLNGPVSWAYSSTQQGGQLAEANADIVKESATAGVAAAAVVAEKAASALPAVGEPIKTEIVNTPEKPANVTETHPVEEDIPEYAR